MALFTGRTETCFRHGSQQRSNGTVSIFLVVEDTIEHNHFFSVRTSHRDCVEVQSGATCKGNGLGLCHGNSNGLEKLVFPTMTMQYAHSSAPLFAESCARCCAVVLVPTTPHHAHPASLALVFKVGRAYSRIGGWLTTVQRLTCVPINLDTLRRLTTEIGRSTTKIGG